MEDAPYVSPRSQAIATVKGLGDVTNDDGSARLAALWIIVIIVIVLSVLLAVDNAAVVEVRSFTSWKTMRLASVCASGQERRLTRRDRNSHPYPTKSKPYRRAGSYPLPY